MAIYIAVLIITKYLVKKSYYKYTLAILNLLFLTVIYPKPYHFLLLILFSYSFTYLIADVFKLKNRLWGILILLIPMLLVKIDGSITDRVGNQILVYQQ